MIKKQLKNKKVKFFNNPVETCSVMNGVLKLKCFDANTLGSSLKEDDGIVQPPRNWRGYVELPQGALARYERDVAAIAWVVSRRGAVPDQIQEGEEVLVPTFEIAANPTVRLSEIKARRFYIVDRA